MSREYGPCNHDPFTEEELNKLKHAAEAQVAHKTAINLMDSAQENLTVCARKQYDKNRLKKSFTWKLNSILCNFLGLQMAVGKFAKLLYLYAEENMTKEELQEQIADIFNWLIFMFVSVEESNHPDRKEQTNA